MNRAALPLLTAVLSGALVAVQQRLNGDLGTALRNPLLAAVVSFSGGLVLMAVLMVRRTPREALRRLPAVPWWCRLAGLGGATLVAVGATAAPRLGVALLTVGLVAGTTVAALAVDRWGLGPGARRPLTSPRVVGAGLCLVAIVVGAADGLRAASPLLLALVVVAGALISAQAAFNGRVRLATSATVATFVNFVVGTTGLLVALGIQGLVSGVRADRWPTDWWLYLGGPIGCVFIAVASVTVSTLGVLRLGLAVTAGQLLGGIALDARRGVSGATFAAATLTLMAVAVSGRGAR